MKKILFVIVFASTGFLTSCGVGAAEDLADDFHKKMDAGEYKYIIENMIDEEAIETTSEEGWYGIFEQIEIMWGKAESREKATGFQSNTNNGITQVQLDYTVNFPGVVVYERLFMVDRGEGTKILGFFMNESKATLEAQAGSIN